MRRVEHESIVGSSSIGVMVVAEQLTHELEGLKAGETVVKSARAIPREDSSGRTALFVELVLSEPPKGAETWPVDDLWELRRMVRDVKARVEAQAESARDELPWYIVFESENYVSLDDEDIDELLDVDG
jgi:hypothetical protein